MSRVRGSVPVSTIYHIFDNKESGEIHYIFKKNILRIRVQKSYEGTKPEWMEDKVYLQFIMKDNEKVSFFLREKDFENWSRYLPNPRKTDIVNPEFPEEENG